MRSSATSLLLLVALCLFASTLVRGQGVLGNCNPIDALPQSEVDALAENLASQTFSDDKVTILTEFTTDLTRGFSSNQTVQVLETFTFSVDMIAAIEMMSKNILGITSAGCAEILSTFKFQNDRLQMLEILANFVVDLRKNSEVIIEVFSFSFDQDKARDIIANAKPRSCLWGDITLPRFDFIIDVSGSMSTTFTTNDGFSMTRLQFVQNELLRVMNTTLSSEQKFNIIKFSASASSWQPGVVPVNDANIESASTYTRALTAGGGTYVLNALKLSITDDEVMGVYLLSDGEPSDSASAAIAAATTWGKPVNTIAFKAGSAGTKFLQDLAQATGGTFRAFK